MALYNSGQSFSDFWLKKNEMLLKFLFFDIFWNVSFAWLWTVAIEKKVLKIEIVYEIYASKYLIFFESLTSFSKRSQILKHVMEWIWSSSSWTEKLSQIHKCTVLISIGIKVVCCPIQGKYVCYKHVFSQKVFEVLMGWKVNHFILSIYFI